MLSSKEILFINLKYYRKVYNLSQEQFAEKVGSNLTYINDLENYKRKPTIDMLDKITDGINKNIDTKINITSSDLIKYNKSHVTNYKRIDEKKNSY